MIGLSFGEIIIILIVGLLIINPKDIPQIIKYIKGFKSYIDSLSSEFKSVLNNISSESDLEILNNQTNLDEINKLLKEIYDNGEKYDGDYDLIEIRKVHNKMFSSKSNKDSTSSI